MEIQVIEEAIWLNGAKIDKILKENGFVPADNGGRQDSEHLMYKTGILYQDPDIENLENVGKIAIRKKWFGLVNENYVIAPTHRRKFIGIIIWNDIENYSINIFGRKYIKLIEELGNKISAELHLKKPKLVLMQEEPDEELYQSEIRHSWDSLDD